MNDLPNNTELTELRGASERSVIVEVVERKIAQNETGDPVELGVPRKIFVRPLPMRRWALAMGYATKILSYLPDSGLDPHDTLKMSMWMIHLIGQIPEELFAILELATDCPPAFFDSVDLDDGVRVALAVVEVNKDFFLQKVWPLLSEVAPTIRDKVESVQEKVVNTSGQTL